MIAAESIRVVSTDRRDYLFKWLSDTTNNVALYPDSEREIRRATMAHLEEITRLADSAVAAQAELDALTGRMNRHSRDHDLCRFGGECNSIDDMKRHRDRLMCAASRAMNDLRRGRR